VNWIGERTDVVSFDSTKNEHKQTILIFNLSHSLIFRSSCSSSHYSRSSIRFESDTSTFACSSVHCNIMYRNKQGIILILLAGFFIHKYYCKEQTYVHNQAKPPRFHIAEFNFDHVSDVYAITLWILLGSLAKVGRYPKTSPTESKSHVLSLSSGFHLSHRLTEKFPESCLLIILGLIVGALLYVTHLAEQKAYVLNSDTFFLFLLPVSAFDDTRQAAIQHQTETEFVRALLHASSHSTKGSIQQERTTMTNMAKLDTFAVRVESYASMVRRA
jgi:hypothetical protein